MIDEPSMQIQAWVLGSIRHALPSMGIIGKKNKKKQDDV